MDSPLPPLAVHVVPLLADNYAYVLHDPAGRDCAVVDPSESAPVADYLAERGLRLRALLATHPHHDHVGGIAGLWRPGVEVLGAAADRGRLPQLTDGLADDDCRSLLGRPLQALAVPGHTRHSLAYYLPDQAALFTGDTLFLAGCGRLFEGTAEQMLASLRRLAALPPATRIFCGHEYTEKNLRFAARHAPSADGRAAAAARLAQLQAQPADRRCSVPGVLAEELAVNPFLQAADAEQFAELRRRRDQF